MQGRHFITSSKLLFLSILFGFYCYLAASVSFAAPNTEVIFKGKRPKIGLVLEGGGAKGFAHVGVIKVLEEQRVPIDMVAGTSMGAIVGAAYSSGRSVKEMEEFMRSTDWDDLFNENAERQNVGYRQKVSRDKEIFGDTKFGIKNGSLVIPSALVQGQNVEPLLQELYGKVPATVSFDNLPVPYRAVAADIETGEAVVLEKGNLAKAARASMSVLGFFAPVEIDGKMLVDGGMCDNLPVDVALSMGADVIIAIKFKDKLKTRDKLDSPFAISGQILDILLESTTKSRIKMLRPGDILLEIDLGDYGATSFSDASQIMAIGEEAARKISPVLKTFAMQEGEYANYYENRTKGKTYAPVIDYVRVEERGWKKNGDLDKRIEIPVGEPFDRRKVEEEIKAVYQDGEYKKISYEIEQAGDRHGVVIKAEEKEWLQNYLRLGFSVEDDFQGDNSYRLAASFRFNDINAYGAYTDLQFEVGESPRLFGEFYQPLDKSGLFFVAPELTLSRQSIPIRQGNDIVAEYFRDMGVLGLKGGLSMGSYGEFTTGWYWGRGRLKRRIGESSLSDLDYDIGEIRSRFVIDHFDNRDFPTTGVAFNTQGTVARDGMGSSSDFEQLIASASKPLTYGATTLLLNAETGQSSDDLSLERSFSLGGFFDISGYEQASLIASDYWVGRASLYRRIAEGGSSFFPFGGYVGGTFEFASLHSDNPQIDDYPSIVAGSLFIGADTPLLPVYFGFGLSDESNHSFYLTVGRLAGRSR